MIEIDPDEIARSTIRAQGAGGQNVNKVSTALHLRFDVRASSLPGEVKDFDWVGGGTSPPAIGPKGQVYAIASNILFVFPPPLQLANRPTQGTTEKARQ